MNSPTPNTMSKQHNPVDADALLRSLEPVVAKPDPTPSSVATLKPSAPVIKPTLREVAAPAQEDATPLMPARESSTSEPARRTPRRAAPSSGGARAKMDVAINPGEGSTALYVRVPRTTHMALKMLALQNQAALEGPQDLATIVRMAIDEFLDRSQSPVRAAG